MSDTEIPKAEIEREVQNRVIKVIKKNLPLYEHIGYLSDQENTNIRRDVLFKYLTTKQKLTAPQANKAIDELELHTGCQFYDDLYNKNKEVYYMLRQRKQVKGKVGELSKQTVYIDWKHPSENIFEIAEEVTVRRDIEDYKNRRPDIVVYVNGIALVIIELKASHVSVSDGIRQQNRNQRENQITSFFSTNQLLFAGNDSEGLYYGVIKAAEQYWLKWKDAAGSPCPEQKFNKKDFPNLLERSLLQMLDPEFLLEFIHDFMLFDGGIKKAARPNQYFAIKAAQERIRKREGGIVWECQGSGKSIIMVLLAQWIKENMSDDPRVVMVTDREELDGQITTGFKDTDETPVRVGSKKELIDALDEVQPSLICTLVHKFGAGNKNFEAVKIEDKKSKRTVTEYFEDLAKELPPGFKAKGNIYVFVDECHRTQGGVLHQAMKKILGDNAMVIGFTGTPILKNEKKASLKLFGSFIHCYKYDEGVADGVVLDLRYKARNVEQFITDQESIDEVFESISEGLNDKAKEELKGRWATLQKLYSSNDRIQKIVADVSKDFMTVPVLKNGFGNAILIANGIYDAYKYYSVFQNQAGMKNKIAVITSYEPPSEFDDIKEGFSSDDESNEEEFKFEKAQEMMGDKTPEEFEEWAKDKFINEPAQMKVLIVVDKLITGFDAPSATYLYIDKEMRDHTLFQAVCRVNRINGEEKKVGHIVDYKDLFNSIRDAIKDYTSGAFKNYDKEDVNGILKDDFVEGKKDLDRAITAIDLLCSAVKAPKEVDNFFDFYCYDQKTTAVEDEAKEIKKHEKDREGFYECVHKLLHAYLAIATVMTKAGYTTEEAKAIHDKVTSYYKIMVSVQRRAGDLVDLKEKDAKMRDLIDNYVSASNSELLASLEDYSFIDQLDPDKVAQPDDTTADDLDDAFGGQGSAAETITAHVRKNIATKHDSNPEHYDKLSERLNRLLQDMKDEKESYKAILAKIILIDQEIRKQNSRDYPEDINTEGLQALYDNLDQNSALAIYVYKAVKEYAEDGWRDNVANRGKKLRKMVELTLQGRGDIEVIMNILKANSEF